MIDENGNFIDPVPEAVRKNWDTIHKATEPFRKQQELYDKLAEPFRLQNQIAQSIAPIIQQTNFTQSIVNAMRVNLPDFSQFYRESAANLIAAQNTQIASLAVSMISQTTLAMQNAIQDAIRIPVMNWFQDINISPIYNYLQEFNNIVPKNFDRRLFTDTYLADMYEAKWFPYAGWNAHLTLVKQILQILDTTRKSKNRVKKIDKVVFAYYDDKSVEIMKKEWRTKDLPEHIMRMLHQSVQAYHRKEYALTITMMATLWEGVIYSKANLPHGTQKQTKDSMEKLIEHNEYSEIFKSYFDEFIMYQCYKPEEVKEDVPGRNGVAHGWYTKYPSKKTALNAILFTDFLLALEPLQEDN